MLSETHRDSVLVVQFRVIRALILRDMRTRFFGHGLGYILAILWPMVHMGLLMALWTALGRVAPYGESTLLFIAVGLVPVMSYMYMARFIMFSVNNNKPLLGFPVVKFLDIILARALLEIAAACCGAALMATILFGIDVPIAPANTVQACLAYAATMLVGLGVGTFNGVIVMKVPAWMIATILLNALVYITSGVLFVPDALPEPVRWWFSWNPMMHAVEWMRQSFYLGYVSLVLDKRYMVGLGAGLFFAALTIERGLRKFLQR
jgi:capsular polysaccharide transport system permease protein